MENNSNYLMHYGVLGMKWGVRRNRSGSSSGGSENKRSMSDDAREARSIRRKKPSEMSNAELRKVNERTRLEQEYSRLNPSTVQKGLAATAAIIGVMNTAVNLYNSGNNLVGLGKKFVSTGKKFVKK